MPCEVLVIGGGPAGASAATWLARGGCDVVLVDRDPGPRDKVCGEFVSVEACRSLRQLGVDLPGLGAVEIARVRLAYGSGISETPLPFLAQSVSRRTMDAAVLASCEVAGAQVFRGAQVEGLERAADGWIARLGNGDAIRTRQVFLATGKHDLRGLPRPKGIQSDLVAFKMHWRFTDAQRAALHGGVELMLFRGGYGGLEPIENGLANFCVVVRRTQLEPWGDLLVRMQQECQLLRERLEGAEPVWERPLALSHIPYGMVQRESRDGIWRLGDQAAVIPSFAGDGMAIALHSGRLAAEGFLRGETAQEFQQKMASDTGRQIAQATWVSRTLVAAPWIASASTRIWPGVMAVLAKTTRVQDVAIVS